MNLETAEQLLADAQLRRDRLGTIKDASTAAMSAMNLISEASDSPGLNPGAIRSAIEAFERAANTLKPLIR